MYNLYFIFLSKINVVFICLHLIASAISVTVTLDQNYELWAEYTKHNKYNFDYN